MSPSRPSARGFSIIEALAAMAVFVIGIVGVMQMNVLASQQNNLARSQTIASKIARDVADSFERLPFNHPVFLRNTGVPANNPDQFSDFNNPDGLYTLQEAIDLDTVRPFLGAADAIIKSEGGGDFYQVAWRSQLVPNTSQPTVFDSRRIAIMVRFPTPGGFRQVTVWSVKYDPASVTLDPDAVLEI
ncbi:prepilin-type N-terminal cleavage/methylation domain-containing protein [Hyalangium rubrum]|uniref:Prepilin-type N-terminal cleavage/methylation domain-containing protein n=1 Tax=Hyalangium rubrum TaxID=3103134 RepID=A0ABU5H6C9_9BACT|nr:prepilin-type N-terminal cleavage/methylation domain-containing protein [Hyalangium sp. s54d21]MDY7227650.1 prepilin-type N-terminal cleavage/methylation domain-containing protein [Hyalangium sp. s54d21]